MRKSLAWLAVCAVLAVGGYRIWDRNTVVVQPPVVTQTAPVPVPEPLVQPVPEPAKTDPRPKAKPKAKAVPKAQPLPTKAQPARPKAKAVPVKAPVQQAPAMKPAAPTDASLPVSCATVRWYVNNAPTLGQTLSDAYNPSAEQIAAAKACLKKKS